MLQQNTYYIHNQKKYQVYKDTSLQYPIPISRKNGFPVYSNNQLPLLANLLQTGTLSPYLQDSPDKIELVTSGPTNEIIEFTGDKPWYTLNPKDTLERLNSQSFWNQPWIQRENEYNQIISTYKLQPIPQINILTNNKVEYNNMKNVFFDMSSAIEQLKLPFTIQNIMKYNLYNIAKLKETYTNQWKSYPIHLNKLKMGKYTIKYSQEYYGIEGKFNGLGSYIKTLEKKRSKAGEIWKQLNDTTWWENVTSRRFVERYNNICSFMGLYDMIIDKDNWYSVRQTREEEILQIRMSFEDIEKQPQKTQQFLEYWYKVYGGRNIYIEQQLKNYKTPIGLVSNLYVLIDYQNKYNQTIQVREGVSKKSVVKIPLGDGVDIVLPDDKLWEWEPEEKDGEWNDLVAEGKGRLADLLRKNRRASSKSFVREKIIFGNRIRKYKEKYKKRRQRERERNIRNSIKKGSGKTVNINTTLKAKNNYSKKVQDMIKLGVIIVMPRAQRLIDRPPFEYRRNEINQKFYEDTDITDKLNISYKQIKSVTIEDIIEYKGKLYGKDNYIEYMIEKVGLGGVMRRGKVRKNYRTPENPLVITPMDVLK